MKKFEIRICFGFERNGDMMKRKLLYKGEAETESLCVSIANATMGVEFKENYLLRHRYGYKVSECCELTLQVK